LKKIILVILLFLSFYTIIFAETKKELFDSGVLFFKQGYYNYAVDQFSRLIKLAPENAGVYKNRGVSYMKQEKFDLAIKDFERAKALFPDLKGIYSNLGVAWFYKKNYKKAIENYDNEIKLAPENYVAYFNRALCFTELGKKNKAIDDLSQTLVLKPDFYLAICYKADLLAQQGENAKAVETYETGIKHTYASEKTAQLKQKIKEIKNIARPENKPEIKNDLNKRYAIQVGAFLKQENANRIKKKMLQRGLDTRILVLQDKKKRIWYILRSGDYPNKTAAVKSMLAIKEKLDIEALVRPLGSW